MGIQDRDYIRRSPDGGERRRASADEKLEESLSGLLRKHPRLLLYLGVGVLVLVVIALALAFSSGGN